MTYALMLAAAFAHGVLRARDERGGQSDGDLGLRHAADHTAALRRQIHICDS
ncbi:MAG TPA: hypothetical protein VFL84_00345 [Gammaproteobacteria bacterium]|nr:hypothetical protein [Gammaproteobacteria bacterium]